MFTHSRISASIDFERILGLPRRVLTSEAMQAAAEKFTARFRTPRGTWTLRPIQGAALQEIETVGGLVAPVRVGGGKTLVSLLAPAVLKAVRPLVLLPAALIERTVRDLREVHQPQWRLPLNIRFYSYEMLGREGAADFLEKELRPDLIICDEVHRLKNLKAGVTRRVSRYMTAHPETHFVGMSGTLLKDDIRDFAHITRWALKDGAPVPQGKHELASWADCLGRGGNPMQQIHPGALLRLAAPSDIVPDDDKATARKAFQRRLLETPGVISSSGEQVGCSLYVQAVDFPVNGVTEANFEKLRTLWELPDGWALSQAVDVWRHARELASGLHYEWDPRAPDSWLNARRIWAAYVREVLSRSRDLDTELQVARAHANSEEWRQWDVIRGTFQINTKAVWHDDSALDFCQKWMERPGIVWVEHAFFGRELSRRSGAPYFGEGGLDPEGNVIEAADPTRPIIASARANSTGRNLQAWNRNLIVSPPAGAPAWEQLLGRTHRDGQTADEVMADVIMTCREHWDGLSKAITAAVVTEQTLGHAQKLILADKIYPEEDKIETLSLSSFRWKKSS